MQRESLKRKLLIRKSSVVVLLGLLWGCGVFTIYSQSHDFEAARWDVGQTIAFDFEPIVGEKQSSIVLSLRYDALEVQREEFMLYVEARTGEGLSHTDSLKIEFEKGSRAGFVRSVDVMLRDEIEWSSEEVSLRFSVGEDITGIESLSVEVSGAQKKKSNI